ncbi:MAG TPA: M20/M25/M40 family metallo-hydrolase [Gemmatimonadaceae bacterium]|nr:M20/M25/M40 family metallo-hydrolase [Gemmatimonadaceae bacterium]
MSRGTSILPRPTAALALVFASLACAVGGATQTVKSAPGIPERAAPGYRTIQESELRADLTFLASDALQGRMSLETGDMVAIEWVASEFKKAGLKPAFGDSYLQPVPLVEYRADRAQSSVTLRRAGTESKFEWADAGGSFKRPVDITAPVVFAGFGVSAPDLGYDDYAGLDVKGKIVLVFEHEPQETNAQSVFNGTANTRHATGRVKALAAQSRGAVALLIVAEPNRSHPANAQRVQRIGGSATRQLPPPAQALQQDTLDIPIVLLSDSAARVLMTTSGITPSQAQEVIDRDLKPQSRPLPDTELSIHLRSQYVKEGITYNVVGLLEGSSPSLRGETVIISSHHDHDGMTSEGIWHGADDNGSGTVGVVALARAFGTNAAKPRRSILFVSFGAEERGLLGSFYMAAHPARDIATTRAMVNFDMIGRDETPSPQTDGLIEVPKETSNRLNLIGAHYSPDYKRVVAAQNAAVGLVLDDRFDNESALNIFFRSDQFPFVLRNVPAFWWFTGFHPDYHHTTDTADKIDYVKMAKILRLAYLTVWAFGDTATPPRFVVNPRPALNP